MLKYALLATGLVITPAAATDEVYQGVSSIPIAFRGEWIDPVDHNQKLTITAHKFDECTFTKIMPANEENDSVSVTWHCPDDRPESKPTKEILNVRKALGHQFLITVNEDDPSAIGFYRRKQPEPWH